MNMVRIPWHVLKVFVFIYLVIYGISILLSVIV